MAASIEVHDSLLKTLQQTKWKHTGLHGFIVGRRHGSGIEAFFPTNCTSSEPKSAFESASLSHQLLPGGFELCGVILVLKDETDIQFAVQKHVPKQLLETHDDESIIVCQIKFGSDEVLTDNFSLVDSSQNVCPCKVTVTREDILSNSVVLKLQAQVPVTFSVDSNSKDWQQSISCEMSRVSRLLSSPASVYSVRDTGVLLTSEEVKGVSSDLTCDKLYAHLKSDDGHVTRSKKRAMKEQAPLGVDLFLLISGDHGQSDVPCCSPVVHHSIGDYTSVKMTLPLNILSVVRSSDTVSNLHSVLTSAISSQLEAFKDCLCQFQQKDKLHLPEAFHFRPSGDQTFVTVVFPKSVSDQDLESCRRDLHQLLMRATDRPLFRRNTAYLFPGEPTPDGYLLNPHTSLSTAGTVGVQYLVAGTYSYHHYMQDRFDDNMWGCAYRSLQTLVSWFRYQGYTDKPIPSHREIQQALVDVGDKEKSFVGSRKWIGSLEVGFCLDQLIGVTCKIMNVSSGADLANKGRELASHFTNQGSPIMIGGGVLAHTILGVDFDEVTGNIRFLILDPHYTGSEDLKVILDKGWCGWKGPDFWETNAHYNLCMPQRPSVI